MMTLGRLIYAGVLAGTVIPACAQPGTLDPVFPSGAGCSTAVFAIEVQPDQKILIGGNFDTYNGAPAGRLVRVFPSGLPDPDFATGSGFNNNTVYGLALQSDGKILASGEFQSFNGLPCPRIVRLNANGTRDLSFNYNNLLQGLRTIAVQADGKILVASISAPGIIRLNPDATFDASFNVGTGGALVQDILLQPDGKILLCGNFTTFNGVTAGKIVRLDPNGAIDPTFVTGTGFTTVGTMDCLSFSSSGTILVGGWAGTYNGVFRSGLSELTMSGALVTAFNPANCQNTHDMEVDAAGRIYVGRSSGPGVVRRILPGGAADPTFTPLPTITGIPIWTLAIQADAGLLIGGSFTEINSTSRSNVARLNTCTSIWYADSDGDAHGDPSISTVACTPPLGYVDDNTDCDDSNATLFPGATCDDGDATTGNDVYQSDCTCAGELIDCLGVAGGTALPGTTCDDGDATTGNDVYQTDCTCVGQLIDCLGVAGGAAIPGTTCDDGVATTGNDVYQTDCTCAGQLIDCLGAAGGSALPGTTCDDGVATTGNDVYQTDCTCAGQLIDCLGVAGGSALPGTTCDDGDAGTSGDVYQADCACAGVATCSEVTFQLNTGAMGGDVVWEILDASGTIEECYGDNFPKLGDCIIQTCCLPEGQHTFSVRLDNGASDFTGGYILRQGNNGRIVHSGLGFFGSEAQHGANGLFNVPMGTDRLIESRCDANGLSNVNNLIAISNPDVAAEVVPGNWSMQTNQAGYEFWIFDPDGGYNHTVYRSLRVSDGGAGGQDTRARTLFLNGPGFNGNPVPLNVELNVRVRHRLPGGYVSEYGPACRLLVNGNVNAYWPTHLVDLPGDALHSCGITTVFDPLSTANRIYAVSLTGGANYRFQWTRVSGGPAVTVTIERSSGSATNNRYMALSTLNAPSWMPNWPTAPGSAAPPAPGEIWNVRVSAKRFGQGQWSAYGPCCLITIGSGQRQLAEVLPGEAPAPTFALWPNPNNGDQVHLAFTDVPGPLGQVAIDMYDATGRLALTRRLWFAEGETDKLLDLPYDLAPGLYTLNAASTDQRFTQRLVVE